MQDLRAVVERINSAELRREAETFRFMEEQKIKKALGPAEWEKLKRSLASHCEAIGESSPTSFRFQEEGVNAVEITNIRNGKTARLSYNSDVPCIMFRTPVSSGHVAFRVSPDGTMVQFIVNDIPRLVDEVSMVIISQITG
jgi:hypothetical protein